MKIVAVIVCVYILISGCSTASISPNHNEFSGGSSSDEKILDIKKLIKLTNTLSGIEQAVKNMARLMAKNLKDTRTDLSVEFIDTLRDESIQIATENVPMLLKEVIPLYHKHYSHKEIKELINFYNTELGKKLIKISPVISKEVLELGAEWGKSLSPKIRKRMEIKMRAVDTR